MGVVLHRPANLRKARRAGPTWCAFVRRRRYNLRNGYNFDKHWTEFKFVTVLGVRQLIRHNADVGLDIARRGDFRVFVPGFSLP